MALLLDFLVQKYPLAKRQTLKRMVETGRVKINGRPAQRLKQEIGELDRVQISDQMDRPGPSLAPLGLIHEDADLLVINKPAGLLTSTNPREKRPTAIAIIRAYLADREPRARAGVIHRLDRDASGLLVFSKNHEAFESLKRQFFEHSVERIYMAVVRGVPNPAGGRIESRLLELSDGRVVTTRNPAKGQLAVTDYKVLRSGGGMSLLQVTLQTGRKHQIRAHFASRGHPIVGDTLYAEGAAGPRLLLAATGLSLDHPNTGQRLTFQIDPPPEIQHALEGK